MTGSDESGLAAKRMKDGTEYRFKLAWWEGDGKHGVAYGNSFRIDTSSGLLFFDGSHGQIILPTNTMRFIIK